MTENEILGRNRLREAFKLNNLQYLEEHPPTQEKIHFSKEYLKNMEKLLKRQEKPKRKFFYATWTKIAACIVAVLLASGSLMSISAIREPVVEFFISVKEKLVEIFFDDENITKAPTEIETVYTLGYIPEGYEIERQFVDSNMISTIFSDGEQKIRFNQSVLSSCSTMDNEEAGFEIIYIDDIKIATIEKKGIKYFYWNTEEYSFYLSIPNDVPLDECMIIIKSMTILES